MHQLAQLALPLLIWNLGAPQKCLTELGSVGSLQILQRSLWTLGKEAKLQM